MAADAARAVGLLTGAAHAPVGPDLGEIPAGRDWNEMSIG